jgi:hypothetical protein
MHGQKECCAYREAALAAAKNSQMTTVPLTGLLGDVTRFQHRARQSSRQVTDCPKAASPDEQIGSFAFPEALKLFDHK